MKITKQTERRHSAHEEECKATMLKALITLLEQASYNELRCVYLFASHMI